MAQQINQGNDANVMLLADGGDFLRLLLREPATVCHFRAAEKLETIINSEDEHVHRARSQLLLDELDELIHAIPGRRWDAKAAHWQRSFRLLFCRRKIQSAGQQEPNPVLREVRF